PRPMPDVIGTRPAAGSNSREQVPTGSEPPIDVSEDRRLLVQRHVDDRIERNDGHEALGRKFQSGHISALKVRRWNEPACTGDLDGWQIHAGYREVLGEEGGG